MGAERAGVASALKRAAIDLGAGLAAVVLPLFVWGLWQSAVEEAGLGAMEAILGPAVALGASAVAIGVVYATLGGRLEAALVRVLTGRRDPWPVAVGGLAAGAVLVFLGGLGAVTGVGADVAARAHAGVALVVIGGALAAAPVAGTVASRWLGRAAGHDADERAVRVVAAEMAAVFVAVALVAVAASGGIAEGIAAARLAGGGG